MASMPIMGWNRFSPELDCILADVYSSYYVRIFGAGLIQMTLFCITIVYSLIAKTAITQKNKINAITLVNHVEKTGTITKLSSWKTHMKMAKNILLVIVGFSCCTLPYSIFIAIISKPKIPEKHRGGMSDSIELFSLTLLLLNSSVNPVIYTIKFPKFRKAFKSLLHVKQNNLDDSLI